MLDRDKVLELVENLRNTGDNEPAEVIETLLTERDDALLRVDDVTTAVFRRKDRTTDAFVEARIEELRVTNVDGIGD